jgi:galactoside O-acetyltransferase
MIIGEGSTISKKASLFAKDKITIGENVRIDDFCVLSGGSGLVIGDHIHIACGAMFYAGAGIELRDFSQFAPRVLVMTTSDDWTGRSLVGPCIPDEFKPHLQKARVIIGRHVLLGANCMVMPGVTIGDGCSVGAFSLVKDSLEPWGIYAGIPARRIGDRNKARMLDLEDKFLEQYNG